MRYRIVTAPLDELQRTVERHLDEGWELHGPPFPTGTFSNLHPKFGQAITRRTKPKPPTEEEVTE